MIRAVFDANTIVAGFSASDGTLRDLFDSWRAGRFQLVLSEHILTETAFAWTKPYWQRHCSPERIESTLLLFRREAIITPVTEHVQGIASHPEDDLVLATAVSAGADILVTGDHRLRDLETYRGISILTPREFLSLLEAEP